MGCVKMFLPTNVYHCFYSIEATKVHKNEAKAAASPRKLPTHLHSNGTAILLFSHLEGMDLLCRLNLNQVQAWRMVKIQD